MESAIPYSGRFRLSEDYIRARRRDEDEWAELAAGIVLFAFKDYVEALYKLIILADSANRTPHETMLTSINPEWVIREAREQAMAKAMKHMERQVIREMKRETMGKDEEAMI